MKARYLLRFSLLASALALAGCHAGADPTAPVEVRPARPRGDVSGLFGDGRLLSSDSAGATYPSGGDDPGVSLGLPWTGGGH